MSRYMPGGDVGARIRSDEKGRLPVEQALRIGEQVCSALEHAHGHGLIHRELKPGVLRLADDGNVTLMFSDMEGFTEMTERLGDREAHRVIHTRNGIGREQLAAHGGTEVELQGDGFLLAFPSPSRPTRASASARSARPVSRASPARGRFFRCAGSRMKPPRAPMAADSQRKEGHT